MEKGTLRAPGIYELGKDKFRLRVQVTDPRTGRRRNAEKAVRGTLTEAKRALLKFKVEVAEREGPIERQVRQTLGEYSKSWMERRLVRLRPSTRGRYADSLVKHILPSLGNIYIRALTSADIERWIASEVKKGLAKPTINGYLAILKSITRSFSLELGIPDPGSTVSPLAKVESNRHGLEAAELKVLLSVAKKDGSDLSVLFFVLALTGMRWGEASALKWNDIDEVRNVIIIERAHCKGIVGAPKSGRPRFVPLLPELREMLITHRRNLIAKQGSGLQDGWMFATEGRDGSVALRKPASITTSMNRWVKEAKLKRHVSPHDLRRTWVDLARQANVDEIVRRTIIGHADGATHELYSTVSASEANEAVGRVYQLLLGMEN